MRRWPWAVGIVAVMAVGLTLLFDDNAPFDFIAGQSPLRLTRPTAYQQHLIRTERSISVYSFQASFDRLAAAAEEELKSKGYEEFLVGANEVIYSMGPSPYVRPGTKPIADWGWVMI